MESLPVPPQSVHSEAAFALTVDWVRWKAEVAPVPAPGAWMWLWSYDVWRAVATTTVRMLRAMAGIPRKSEEP